MTDRKTIYHPGCPLETILTDSWSRGFEMKQALREARELYPYVTGALVRLYWLYWDTKYDLDMRHSR